MKSEHFSCHLTILKSFPFNVSFVEVGDRENALLKLEYIGGSGYFMILNWRVFLIVDKLAQSIWKIIWHLVSINEKCGKFPSSSQWIVSTEMFAWVGRNVAMRMFVFVQKLKRTQMFLKQDLINKFHRLEFKVAIKNWWTKAL